MKKIYYLFIFTLVFSSYVNDKHTTHAEESIHVSANQAVLIEQATGRVLYEKDSHEPSPVASITKVMTALLAIEYGDLKDKVSTSKRATSVGGSSIYLQVDEALSLEDLLYGLMLRSGNDAAVAIAEHIAGSVEGFSFLMNEKARYLGMTNTQFMNPHGLDEDGHYSTAYDIALLMRHAMENDVFKEISNTKSYLSENRDYKWFNKNKLLTHLYPHSTGGKTGFTKKAGRTLVSTAMKDDIELIVVTLDASNDWNDHIQLYERYFDKLNYVKLENKGKRKVELEVDQTIYGVIEEPIILAILDEEVAHLNKRISLDKNMQGNKLGSLAIELHGEEIMKVPLYRQRGWFAQFKHLIEKIVRYDDNG
ncbi:MAG TPA: D-alanyl-D-alanine carboxypeptidase family protein [Pseudogracilibacillus sp.]|nr:D-alanyl-D-alanine carboxypeptidase family protein [Pseudogracilibacillus sp.]